MWAGARECGTSAHQPSQLQSQRLTSRLSVALIVNDVFQHPDIHPLHGHLQPTNPLRGGYKDASQLLVAALGLCSQIRMLFRECEKDAFQFLVSALVPGGLHCLHLDSA